VSTKTVSITEEAYNIVLNAKFKFDTYLMRKTIPAQENAGLVADDFFEMLH